GAITLVRLLDERLQFLHGHLGPYRHARRTDFEAREPGLLRAYNVGVFPQDVRVRALSVYSAIFHRRRYRGGIRQRFEQPPIGPLEMIPQSLDDRDHDD